MRGRRALTVTAIVALTVTGLAVSALAGTGKVASAAPVGPVASVGSVASVESGTLDAVEVPRTLERTVRISRLAVAAGTAVVRQPIDNRYRWLLAADGALRPLPFAPDVERVVATRTVVYGAQDEFGGDDEPRVLSRYDVASGRLTTTRLPVGQDFVAATDDAWLSHDRNRRVLLLHRAGGTATLTPGSQSSRVPAVLRGDVLVARVLVDDRDRIYLYDLATGRSRVLQSQVLSPAPGGLALDDRRVAWAGWATERRTRISYRSVSGGPTATFDVTDYGTGLFLTDDAVGYVSTSGRVVVRPFGSQRRRTVGPAGVTSAVGRGPAVLVAVGGPPATAGLYRIGPGRGVTRLASAPVVPAPVTQLALAGDTLYTADLADRSRPYGHRVRARALRAGSPPRVGASILLPGFAKRGVPLAFSADRALLRAPVKAPAPLRFLDGGRLGRSLRQPGLPVLSGPYGTAQGRAFRADGVRLRVDSSPYRQFGSLFGSRLVTADADDSQVWLYDLTRPLSRRPYGARTNPRVLRGPACLTGDYPCATTAVTAGDVVAWVDQIPATGWGRLVVHDVSTGHRSRTTLDEPVAQLTTDGTAVAWVQSEEPQSEGDLYLAPAGRPGSAVPVAHSVTEVRLDGGWLAWRTVSGRAFVARVPFGGPQRPRLLGVVGTRFSPDGDGRGDVWRPQFDLSRPARDTVLTVRDGSRVLWRAPVTAVRGSIRGVRWDGRDSAGRRVPAGTYTWTLTGRAADGGGPVTGLDGVRPATGKVTLSR